MLIIEKKSASGIFTAYNNPRYGHGIFDFVKIIFQKGARNSFIQSAAEQAKKAINSSIGQKAIATAKEAAQSKLGQELQQTVISEITKKAQKTTEDALNKIGVEAPKSILTGVAQKTQQATEQALKKLGITPPVRAVKRKRKSKKGPKAKKSKGKGFFDQTIYPTGVVPIIHDPRVHHYGRGIIIE